MHIFIYETFFVFIPLFPRPLVLFLSVALSPSAFITATFYSSLEIPPMSFSQSRNQKLVKLPKPLISSHHLRLRGAPLAPCQLQYKKFSTKSCCSRSRSSDHNLAWTQISFIDATHLIKPLASLITIGRAVSSSAPKLWNHSLLIFVIQITYLSLNKAKNSSGQDCIPPHYALLIMLVVHDQQSLGVQIKYIIINIKITPETFIDWSQSLFFEIVAMCFGSLTSEADF